MNRVNYQKKLDKVLAGLEKFPEPGNETIQDDTSRAKEEMQGGVPTLFLHSCCAPCSSYVLEYLSVYFEITVFYYNPNLSFEEEYRKRLEEQKRLIATFNAEGHRYPIHVLEGDYEPEVFYRTVAGWEDCPEGGERCFRCYELRLRETAERAAIGGYDYFATTLTLSPLKNAGKLNEIGQALSQEYGVRWLPSDFKKRDGYKRSIELSAQYQLYRQNYCGCIYSMRHDLNVMKQLE